MDNFCGSMGGCNGRLCRNARRLLRRMPVFRYPLAGGLSDMSAVPETGWVCGLLTRAKYRSGNSSGLRVEGRPCGGASLPRLTVVACSLGNVQNGDRITAEGKTYRVCSVEGSSPYIARLMPDD